jgi:hypothetical protein
MLVTSLNGPIFKEIVRYYDKSISTFSFSKMLWNAPSLSRAFTRRVLDFSSGTRDCDGNEPNKTCDYFLAKAWSRRSRGIPFQSNGSDCVSKSLVLARPAMLEGVKGHCDNPAAIPVTLGPWPVAGILACLCSYSMR